jgi:DNA-directed RNA polymerase subunit M/transcription elongation factor TFIIS
MCKCPRCGGLLEPDNDGYEHYYVCGACSRHFHLDLQPVAMTPERLKEKYNIMLIGQIRDRLEVL